MISMLLPLAVRLIGYFLDKSKADAETRKAFLDFVNVAQAKGLVSVKLKDSYDSQLERIKNELNKPGTPPT